MSLNFHKKSAKLVNMRLHDFCFQDCWKVSSEVPVFKNFRDRSIAQNYWPVSLFSVVSKIFRKRVINRFACYLEICCLFSHLQYDFKSSHSTADLDSIISYN